MRNWAIILAMALYGCTNIHVVPMDTQEQVQAECSRYEKEPNEYAGCTVFAWNERIIFYVKGDIATLIHEWIDSINPKINHGDEYEDR